MAGKPLKGTGILKGLTIPESCRGKYVLIRAGKVQDSSRSVAKLIRGAKEKSPLILAVPKDDQAIAAY